MKSAFISPEEQKIVDETNRPGMERSFLAHARQHPKSVILTYYRAMYAACGECTAKRPALAKRWLKRIFPAIREAALHGDPAAQNCMGCLYIKKEVAGFVVPYNCKEALRWFRKSARRGFLRAQMNMALAYRNGRGVKKNYARAAMWYRRAAEQGDYCSEGYLGMLYHMGGHGLRKDYVHCFEWIRRAAERGSPEDEWYLGTLYELGQGVNQSYEQAVEWYRKSVDHGSPTGLYLLGVCYWKGRGVEPDRARAWQMYLKAAEIGSPFAQRMVGLGYWHGYGGLEIDMKKAKYWLTKAAKANLSRAREDLKSLKASLRHKS